MRNPILTALAVANVALALGLAALWVDRHGQPRNAQWTPPEPIQPDYLQMLPTVSGPSAARTDAFLELLERPLFSASRRPPPPPPPPTPPAPPDLLANAQLLGIYHSGTSSGAIIQIEGKSRRIRLNESLNGWQLQSVEERSALFSNGGQTRQLPLARAKMGAARADSASALPATGAAPAAPAAPAVAQEPAPGGSAASPPRKRRFGP